MPMFINEESITFDDVLLVPQFSDIKSRSDVDISTQLFNHYKLNIPIISANMSSVTEAKMAIKMGQLGGMGILHRYADISEVNKWIELMHQEDVNPIVPSIGIGPGEIEKGIHYWKVMKVDAVTIDVAHGDCQGMLDTIKALKDAGVSRVIAGNVATSGGFSRLAIAGADIVKVGIGPGSLCTTRLVTGAGVPQLTALKDCYEWREHYGVKAKIIADGGLRTSGDIVKALCYSDAVMLGNLLAATEESPSMCISRQLVEKGTISSVKYKSYKGMASREARSEVADVSNYTPEGEAMMMRYKGPIEPIIKNLVGGIKSGFSYCGINNLADLQECAILKRISANSVRENGPHGKT